MPLLWISLAFLAGIILGSIPIAGQEQVGNVWAIAALTALVLWALLRWLAPRLPARPRIFRPLRWLSTAHPMLRLPPVFLLLVFFAGAARLALNAPDLERGHIAALNDQGRFRIQAIVAAPPDQRTYATLVRLSVEQAAQVAEDGSSQSFMPTHGTALAVFPTATELDYGDRLVFTANPVLPPQGDEFSYRAYLGRQDVYTYITFPKLEQRQPGAGSPILAAIYFLRGLALKKLYHLFPAPEAPLLAGILLGIDQDIPAALTRAFQDTGTAHVIAISGFNIAILLELFSRLFGKILSRWWAMLAAILVIAGYSILVGASPSVVRAAIMGSLALVAAQIGRRNTGYNSLTFTAALMCCANPQLLWDASFQLSFGATLGLILFGDRFQNSFSTFLAQRMPAQTARKISGPVGEYFLLTLAAQLMTLPIILFHFQRISLSSLLANPLILPVQPMVMVLSGVAVLAGLVADPVGHLLAWAAWPFTAYTIRMVEALAGIPGGVVSLGKMSLPAVLALYALILAPISRFRFPRLWAALLKPGILLTLCGLIATLAGHAALTRPDGKIHLTLFNLENEPVLLIRGPGGETVLINGGPNTQLLNDAVGRRLPIFERHLDALVINSSRSTAINSLPGFLDLYQPGHAYWGNAIDDKPARGIERLIEGFKTYGVPEHRLIKGEALSLGQNMRLEILQVEDQGSALLLRGQNFRVLVPAGVSPQKIARENLTHLSVLVLEDRDLANAPPETWSAFAPQAIVYTPGDGSLPVEATNWLSILPDGWVQFTADGLQMWVEAKNILQQTP